MRRVKGGGYNEKNEIKKVRKNKEEGYTDSDK